MKIHLAQYSTILQYIQIHVNWCFPTSKLLDGNRLRLDWLALMDAYGAGVKLVSDDLFGTPLEQVQIDFENEGGETFICGNPPYLGNTYQSAEQKADIRNIVAGRSDSPGFLDYVAGWFIKAADYIQSAGGVAAFVSTNSICQGQSVPIIWPVVYSAGCDIVFAYTSFKWANLASNNAGVTVAVVGIGAGAMLRRLYTHQDDGTVALREGASITPYLTIGERIIVNKQGAPISGQGVMEFGNKPSDGGHLLLNRDELDSLGLSSAQQERFIRRIYGAHDFINDTARFCVWIEDEHLQEAQTIPALRSRIDAVRELRLASRDKGARTILAKRPHQMKLMRIGKMQTIIVPIHSSESRPYLPVGLTDDKCTLTNAT